MLTESLLHYYNLVVTLRRCAIHGGVSRHYRSWIGCIGLTRMPSPHLYWVVRYAPLVKQYWRATRPYNCKCLRMASKTMQCRHRSMPSIWPCTICSQRLLRRSWRTSIFSSCSVLLSEAYPRNAELSQDKLNGGISDRADDECDVYHTFFGIAGLSILGYPGLEPIDPVYALPTVVTKRCLNIAWKQLMLPLGGLSTYLQTNKAKELRFSYSFFSFKVRSNSISRLNVSACAMATKMKKANTYVDSELAWGQTIASSGPWLQAHSPIWSIQRNCSSFDLSLQTNNNIFCHTGMLSIWNKKV